MEDTPGAVLDDMDQASAKNHFVVTNAAVHKVTCAVLELSLCDTLDIVRQWFIVFDEHIAGRAERVAAKCSIVCCLLHLKHGMIQCYLA